MASPDPSAAVAAALEPSGLVPRGWLLPDRDFAPLLANGNPVWAICLVGHEGGRFWPVFTAWWQMHSGCSDPLDTWSRAVIEPVAAALGGEAVYPSDRPWQPFQQWAMIAEGLKPSPLGMLIHPDSGLWHGYRGALLFGQVAVAGLGLPVVTRASTKVVPHPCDRCVEKPCLSACPVDAFTQTGFAAADCRTFLDTETGRAGCMDSGCMARDACPVGRRYRYSADQVRFHMTAFGG